MTDRELLVFAAKAAGIVGTWELDKNFTHERWYFNVPYDNHGMLSGFEWNPLTDDGDEARLEAALRFDVVWFDKFVSVGMEEEAFSDHGGDAKKARRYAGVRAAARVGKDMP